MDRISELPDVIIQHIISFLEYKEAARTMVLSKPWLTTWSTRQFLDFDQTHFSKITPDSDTTFLTHVDKTLQNYSHQKIPIQKFRLHIQTIKDRKFLPYIKKWLLIVLQNNPVIELDFSFRPTRSWKSNLVPPQIFGSKSLQVLKVSNPPPCAYLVLGSTDIMCRNLKSLNLSGVLMDDSTFHNLISCCTLIEELVLANFGYFKVHIANLPYLRVLKLFNHGNYDAEISIHALKLHLLTCRTKNTINIIGECRNLRVLSLRSSSIVDEKLQKILSMNQLLRDLYLHRCNKLARVNFSGSSLEFLTIKECDNLTRINISGCSLKFLMIKDCSRLKEAIIDAPELEMVEYYNSYSPREKIINISSSRPLRKAHVWVQCFDVNASWFNDLREFLTVFLKSCVEIKCIVPMKFNSEGFRAIPVTYGHEVERLKVNYRYKVCIEHLECLISICRPKTVICDYPDRISDDESVRNFCKKLTSKKIPKCCKSDEIKCWRHYLYAAELYIWDGIEKKPLRLNKFSLSRFFKATKFNYVQNGSVCFNLEWKCEK